MPDQRNRRVEQGLQDFPDVGELQTVYAPSQRDCESNRLQPTRESCDVDFNTLWNSRRLKVRRYSVAWEQWKQPLCIPMAYRPL
jgi:hypothetical protein